MKAKVSQMHQTATYSARINKTKVAVTTVTVGSPSYVDDAECPRFADLEVGQWFSIAGRLLMSLDGKKAFDPVLKKAVRVKAKQLVTPVMIEMTVTGRFEVNEQAAPTKASSEIDRKIAACKAEIERRQDRLVKLIEAKSKRGK